MTFVHLFTPYTIRGVEFRNRIFSSAHQTILADNWCPTDEMAAYHGARAAGGAGLIIVEAARPHSDAVTSSSYIDVSRDECIPGYQKISDAVHRHGCRVFGQIAHGGRVLHKVTEGFLEFLMLLQQSLITGFTLCPGPCPRIMSGR